MASNTFPRSVRILSTEEYDKVFKNPVRASEPGVLVLARKNDTNCSRLGLVIPKKVLKRAVWRNRVKRIARETFRLNQHSLPNIDLVILARPKIEDIRNSELSAIFRRLWLQISHRLEK
ncbi:MAG: ribonuclease P protein component [Aeromonadales bacterium]|nr:ribonuclease P protein component [Aeromonadales bacterium]